MINLETLLMIHLKISILIMLYFTVIKLSKNQTVNFSYISSLVVGFFILFTIGIELSGFRFSFEFGEITKQLLDENSVTQFIYSENNINFSETVNDMVRNDSFLLYFYFVISMLYIIQFLISLKQSYKIKSSSTFLEIFDGYRLYLSNSEQSPFVIGFFKPSIILPKSSTFWSTERRLHVLLHEKSHILKFDFFSNTVFQVLKGLLIFNPLYHLYLKKVILFRELACDEFVINKTNNVSHYALDIVDIARTILDSKK